LDNIFFERLWRSVKYENIYPRNYRTMQEARKGLEKYFEFYNNERFHQSLSYRTPRQAHFTGRQDNDQEQSSKREMNLNENPYFLS